MAARTQIRLGHIKGEPLRYLRGHAGHRRIPLSDRFWSKVEKTEECWLWKGAKHKNGYGSIVLDGRRLSRKYSTPSRVAWILERGMVPCGMEVCHHCDNPECVRPEHLFLGSHSDNMQDMARKGRQAYQRNPEIAPRGQEVASSVLTDEQVREIRDRYGPAVGRGGPKIRGGAKQSDLAKEFGVSQVTISAIIRRKSWGHI